MRQLASEAGVDLDEALVRLWYNGFDHLSGPEDAVPGRTVQQARRALGLATRRDLKTAAYWQELFGLDKASFENLMLGLGIKTGPAARVLPRNAVSLLKSEARRRDLARTLAAAAPAQPAPAPQVLPPIEWNPPGRVRELRWLTPAEVKAVHEELAADFAASSDPISPSGVRSLPLLESAVYRPQTSLGGILKYPTVESAAAALLHSIVQDHPFHNGNKRAALVAALVFIDEHGLMPTCHEDELFKMILLVAQHRIADGAGSNQSDAEVLAIAHWFADRLRPYEVGEFLIPWRKLRQILVAFGCEVELTGGNRANIYRRRIVKRRLLGDRVMHLRTQIFYGDDGREVARNTLKKVREELHLDDEHGVDSAAFYGKAPTVVSDFIERYRKTLQRLARL